MSLGNMVDFMLSFNYKGNTTLVYKTKSNETYIWIELELLNCNIGSLPIGTYYKSKFICAN